MASREWESGPAYRFLSRQLRAAIAAGTYRGGVQLPTEAELVEQYGVSRQTVRRAFQDLVAEGVVYRVPGRGTFADETQGRYLRQHGSIEDLMSLSSDTTMEIVRPLQRRVDIDVAGRLRLETDVVYSLALRRFHDGIPFVLTTVHLPERIAKHLVDVPEMRLAAVSSHTVIGLLEPHLDSPIVEAAQSITVSPASAEVAADLGCDRDNPMLRVDRLYSDSQGQPMDLSVSYFLPEHYTYRITLRRTT